MYRLGGALWEELDLDPDPVDLVEDALAARRGLVCHPALDQDAWRGLRGRFIEAVEPEVE